MLGVLGRAFRWNRNIGLSRWGYLNTVSGGGGHDLQGVSGSPSAHGSSVLA